MKRKIYINICFLSILTILMTTILTLIICYRQFSDQIKKDLVSETNLLVNNLNIETNDAEYLKSIENKNKRITLISSDGRVIFDNTADFLTMANHNDRPEVIAAKSKGFGESERISDTLDVKTFYYAVLLNDGSVIRAGSTTNSIYSVFINIIPVILIITFIILIFDLLIAMKLTKKIIRPINEIDLDYIDDEKIYEELLPFIKRIRSQNKKINSQMEQIKFQKDRLNTISENMNEGLIVLDSSGMVLSANRSALNIFGLTEADVIRKSMQHLTRDLELIEFIKSAPNGGKGTKTIQIDGNTYQLFSSPVFENETVCGAVLLFFDVSERTKAEKIRREFSANVSHELKTPITTILGYSQMINNGMAKQEDIKSFTLKIENESKRLIELIEDIIKLSRLDEQNITYEIQSVNLLDIAKEAVLNLENQIKEKNISVTFSGTDTYISGNELMLKEMIFNLFDNAVKYNKDGGSIDILTEDSKITVSDTGIGISKENQERIFERFYQVDKSRSKKVSGTGLGLSIVKHTALFHKAEIIVESEPDKGTKITVDFKQEI